MKITVYINSLDADLQDKLHAILKEQFDRNTNQIAVVSDSDVNLLLARNEDLIGSLYIVERAVGVRG